MSTDSITDGSPDGEGMELSPGASTYKDDPYDKLYWWLLSIPLDPATLGILCRIITLSGINGRVWYARNELAKACRCSGRTLYSHLRVLKEHGLVKLNERRAEGKTTIVELTSTVDIVKAQRARRQKKPVEYEGLKPIEHWLRSTVVPPEKAPKGGRQYLPTPQANIAYPLGNICPTWNPHPVNVHPVNVGRSCAADAARSDRVSVVVETANQERNESVGSVADLPENAPPPDPAAGGAPSPLTEDERTALLTDAAATIRSNPAAALATQAFALLGMRPRDERALYKKWLGKLSRTVLPSDPAMTPDRWWVCQRWVLTDARRDPAAAYDPLWLRDRAPDWRRDGCNKLHYSARRTGAGTTSGKARANEGAPVEPATGGYCRSCYEPRGGMHNLTCTAAERDTPVRPEDCDHE